MTARRTTRGWRVLAAGPLAVLALNAAHAQAPIETTTPAGDRILLYPDGRWEYADPAKRAASPKPAPPAAVAPGAAPSAGTPSAGTPSAATPVAATPVAAGACPPDSQGHLFGLGRCVPPGDRDYNRGSMSGKGR
jgi:uncharacterized membrane protein